MTALSLTTVTVKDASGSNVTTNVGDNGTGKSPATAVLGSDGAHFLPSGDDPTRAIRVDPAGTTTQPVADKPQASGGVNPYSFVSTAAVQAANIKATPGQVYSIEFFNNGTSPVYVRLYDKASAPASTDTPFWRGLVPGNSAGSGS